MSNKIRIKIFGWKNSQLDQISRIEEGLKNQNCEIVSENPDLVYSNNDMYDDILDYAGRQAKKPFIILNVLDLQINNHLYDLNKVKEQLIQADAITCISNTVKQQIKEYINLDAHVIFNPIKDIIYKEINKKIPFLYVGRANDVRKRFYLIKESFKEYPDINNNLIICGSEKPVIGNYVGIVDNDTLNHLYNISKFLLLPSSFEGLGLPMIEAMVAGCIPITCSDNMTAIEFSPSEFICEPNPDSFLAKLIEINNNYEKYHKLALTFGNKYYKLMNKNQIAANILNIYNKLC